MDILHTTGYFARDQAQNETASSNWNNATQTTESPYFEALRFYYEYESYVRIIVPTIFGIISIFGFLGNISAIIVLTISLRRQTNSPSCLILNLAIADLIFIIVCVPLIASGFTLPVWPWPFGVAACKMFIYMTYASAYGSVYTLTLLSLDRFLAVAYPIKSRSIRTTKNTIRCIVILWIVILGANVPMIPDYDVPEVNYFGEMRPKCVSYYDQNKIRHMQQLFYGLLFIFGYLIPLSLTCLSYGCMLKRLNNSPASSCANMPGGSRASKRVTKIVLAVIITWTVCWLPVMLFLLVQSFGYFPNSFTTITIKMASNSLAYMNSCLNPYLYAFLMPNFKKTLRQCFCNLNIDTSIFYLSERRSHEDRSDVGHSQSYL